eukprot:GGOE01002458.1.p1 GENE.GGOE01002458.1~~GGOE01002458.1.p1  ORF type:complete len:557 (+),score=136.79 GGOE01002458.1:62-1732(+)
MGLIKYAIGFVLVALIVYLEVTQSDVLAMEPVVQAASVGADGQTIRDVSNLEPNPSARRGNHANRLVNQTWTTDGPRIPVLGVSVFVNAELLVRLLNSIDYHVEHVVVIQNGKHPGVAKVLTQLREEQPGWIIQAYPENVGCAGAWNKIIEAVPNADYYIISNDDIAFHPGALRHFALGVEKHRTLVQEGRGNKVILYPSHGNLMWRSPPWSCFAILREIIDTVGVFDTNFWPVYHEDYDYMCRMARVGMWQTLIPEARVQHGWATDKYEPGMERASKDQGKVAVLDEYRQQQQRHERGSPYYALKWGIGETPGIFDAGNGYWNKTCSGNRCTPQAPVLFQHPFNDSSLPLSFFRLDPELRRCLQFGGGRTACRYNWRLLPHPETVPHDIYMAGARRWMSRDLPPSGNGQWLADKEMKVLSGEQFHSKCFMDGCNPFGPSAAFDDDFGSFFAFQGVSGFITFELTGCMRITSMLFHSSLPCDAGDAKELLLQSSMAKVGPWKDAIRWAPACSTQWSQSPPFSVEAIYLRLQVLSNNGYQAGTRIPEVTFLRSGQTC